MARKPKILDIAHTTTKQGCTMLRMKAAPVPLDMIMDSNFQELLDDMVATQVEKGIGLAAPQVFRSLRVIVVSSRPCPGCDNAPEMAPTIMINPVMLERSNEKVTGIEGCLSIPDVRALVNRHVWVRVAFTDREGNDEEMLLEGLPSRVFQHECDHLEGILFIDGIPEEQFLTIEQAEQLCLSSGS